MYISKVKINGFLSFKDFKIKLDPHTNIIVGTNGTGKSNFLKLVHYAIYKNMGMLREYNKHEDAYINITFSNIDDPYLSNFTINHILRKYLNMTHISICPKYMEVFENNYKKFILNNITICVNKFGTWTYKFHINDILYDFKNIDNLYDIIKSVYNDI